MMSVAKDWNPKQKALKSFLSSSDEKQAVALCLQMHSQLHDSQLTLIANSYQDMLVNDLSEMCFRHMPFDSFSSIAWNLWHITRIEDAVCNILIADEPQIFSKTLKERMGASLMDTGNAMDLKEAIAFSKAIKMNELLNYRFKVGKESQKIIKGLSRLDFKKKPHKRQLDRLLKENVIINHNESIWLLDYWSKKTIAGLLLMPITRHQIVHLNNCMKLKAKFMQDHGTTV
ncbi:MAG: DinB family protein [Desulfobacterales bacterium]|nr:DinB family protein [Desulfobacterales bacterium]